MEIAVLGSSQVRKEISAYFQCEGGFHWDCVLIINTSALEIKYGYYILTDGISLKIINSTTLFSINFPPHASLTSDTWFWLLCMCVSRHIAGFRFRCLKKACHLSWQSASEILVFVSSVNPRPDPTCKLLCMWKKKSPLGGGARCCVTVIWNILTRFLCSLCTENRT